MDLGTIDRGFAVATARKKFLENCMTASNRIYMYAYNIPPYTISPVVY
jgi:hypothetical protein